MSYIQYIVMAPNYIVSGRALCSYAHLHPEPSSGPELRTGLHLTLSARRMGTSKTALEKLLKLKQGFHEWRLFIFIILQA